MVLKRFGSIYKIDPARFFIFSPRPLDKIDIQEHTKVKLELTIDTEHSVLKENALDGIIDIAEDCINTNLSTDHNKYLYGDASK